VTEGEETPLFFGLTSHDKHSTITHVLYNYIQEIIMKNTIGMSSPLPGTKSKKKRSDKFDKLIGPTDPIIDAQARDRLITARVGLLLKHSFFGNLATRLQLINADEWCPTAATDGMKLYYNSRFIMMLKPKEVMFLVAHEILHVVYDHLDRLGNRDPQLFNIANDYAVNADLKKHSIGEFITTVPCLYEEKYAGKSSEEIYADLMKNIQKINIDDLIDKMLDEHLDGDDDGEDGDGEDGDKKGKGKRPTMSEAEREKMRKEIRDAIVGAAQQAGAGELPAGVERLVRELTDPVMNWRELIQTSLTSAIKSDYTWMRPSRRSWHMDAIMPGMNPGEEIEVDVYIDLSGSISHKQGMEFLTEVMGMMDAFDGYKVRVACFDTEVYNAQEFDSDNMDSVEDYKLVGGGGTDFTCIFKDLKNIGRVPNRLIVFTDGMPFGSWGDAEYCDTLWIIHGSNDIKAPFGTYAYYDDHKDAQAA
jgi:predicted metal-dependent peptidase